MQGRIGGKWSSNNFALMEGCSGPFCVGDAVYNKERSAEAVIVALQKDGKFVIQFTTGTLSGRTGSNWSASGLIPL